MPVLFSVKEIAFISDELNKFLYVCKNSQVAEFSG